MSVTNEIPESGKNLYGFLDTHRTGEYFYPAQVMSEIQPCWTYWSMTDSGNFHFIEHSLAVPNENEDSASGVIVVIPAYKEERAIGDVVSMARMYAKRVIVVDDGSPDRTSEIARQAGAEVIRLEENRGKAYALLLGLRHARDLGCSAAVTLDGDGQHWPWKIPDVVRPVLDGKADLVIGSRFLSESTVIPTYRIAGQKMLDIFTNLASGYQSTDSQSGFRALSPNALKNLDFVSSGYCIESDMIAHFAERDLAITEVPIPVTYEVPNLHKMNPVKHGLSVLSSNLCRITRRKPHTVFGLIGFTFGIITVLVASPYLMNYYPLADAPLFVTMAGVVLSGFGLSSMVMGSRKIQQSVK